MKQSLVFRKPQRLWQQRAALAMTSGFNRGERLAAALTEASGINKGERL
jgi:hypothetical protein